MSSSYKEFIYPVSEGIRIAYKKDGVPLEYIRIRISDRIKDPISIKFTESYVAIDDIIVEFENYSEEVLFLQDLYFILEECNRVPSKLRMTNSEKIITAEDLLKEAEERFEKTFK